MPSRLLSFIAPPAVEQTAKTGHRGRSRRAFSNSRGRLLGGIPPEMSNFYCHPGRAGGTPLGVYLPVAKKSLRTARQGLSHKGLFSEVTLALDVTPGEI